MSRPYSRSPGGLLTPLHATLKGRVRWQVLDERGVPEIPRTPSGIPVGPVEGIEQPNLITNVGMDNLATQRYRVVTPSITSGWRRFMAVGTGSAVPSVTDTALDNEVQAAASSGSFSAGSALGELDTDTNVWRATVTVTRVITMTADRNLTEFALRNASSGDANIRELLRDGGGTPITVSLLNGKTIRLDHSAIVEMPAPAAGFTGSINVEEYDVGNNLTATIPYDITYGQRVSDPTSTNIIRADNGGSSLATLFDLWEPHSSYSVRVRAMVGDQPYVRSGSAMTSSNFQPNSTTLDLVAYTPGTYTRVKRATVPAGEGNVVWTGFFVGTGGSSTSFTSDGGMLVRFDDPGTYEKVNTDTLRVGIVSTWARA